MNRMRKNRRWMLYYLAMAWLGLGLGASPAHALCNINGDAMGCAWTLSPCPWPCARGEYVEQWFSPDCPGTDTCQHGTCIILEPDYVSYQCVYVCYYGEWTRCKLTWEG